MVLTKNTPKNQTTKKNHCSGDGGDRGDLAHSRVYNPNDPN